MAKENRGARSRNGPAGAEASPEADANFFEKRVDALLGLLSHPDRNVIGTDELRRMIKALPREESESLTFYERRLTAITMLLLEKGVLSEEDIGDRIHELQHRLGIADHEH
jgi:hypothetical protein